MLGATLVSGALFLVIGSFAACRHGSGPLTANALAAAAALTAISTPHRAPTAKRTT